MTRDFLVAQLLWSHAVRDTGSLHKKPWPAMDPRHQCQSLASGTKLLAILQHWCVIYLFPEENDPAQGNPDGVFRF